MKEKIFDLTLSIKNPDAPFNVERSIGVQSGDLIQVFSRFQIELVKLLREMHREELANTVGPNDDIPF